MSNQQQSSDTSKALLLAGSRELAVQQEAGLPLGNIETYVHWANKIPLLTEEEELAYANALFHDGDLSAARKLILPHLRLVVKIARQYQGYGLPFGDLIQEGNIGLMKAVRRFNPDIGVRLASFAIHWIRAEIHDYVLKNWRIVKVATTKAQRKLFFNLRKHSNDLGWFSESEVKALAEQLSVPEKEVRTMEMRLRAIDTPFDPPNESFSDTDSLALPAPEQYLSDDTSDPALLWESSDLTQDRLERLHKALQVLDDRSSDIICSRWLNTNKSTLEELAEKYGVSAERIRQIEKAAMKKVKKAMLDM